MVIFDKEKQRLVEYTSTSDFNSKIVAKLASPQLRKYLKYENYNNGQYSYFEKNIAQQLEPSNINIDIEPEMSKYIEKVLNNEEIEKFNTHEIENENDGKILDSFLNKN